MLVELHSARDQRAHGSAFLRTTPPSPGSVRRYVYRGVRERCVGGSNLLRLAGRRRTRDSTQLAIRHRPDAWAHSLVGGMKPAPSGPAGSTLVVMHARQSASRGLGMPPVATKARSDVEIVQSNLEGTE